MASSALVGAGGSLSVVSSCSSTSASLALRSVRNYQPPGCLLALPKRGVAVGVSVRSRGSFLPPILVAFVQFGASLFFMLVSLWILAYTGIVTVWFDSCVLVALQQYSLYVSADCNMQIQVRVDDSRINQID
jgi:hypothetical protein